MDGVLNLNKPLHISSHRAVALVKKRLGAGKAGHAGTLDPLAEGVLLVCVNRATKISRFLSGMNKEYDATLLLGKVTDTYDSEGTVTGSADISGVSRSDIENVIGRFRGRIEQVPPMYSAVKIDGQPLYKMARRGRTIERKARNVEIFRLELVSFEPPGVRVKVVCSKGTYIRSLAYDIGEALGVGAYLDRLVRTRVGQFSIDGAAGIEDVNLERGVCSIDDSLIYMTEMRMRPEAAVKLQNGVPVEYSVNNISNFDDVQKADIKDFFRLKNSNGELFAIGKMSGNMVTTERVLLTKPKEVF